MMKLKRGHMKDKYTNIFELGLIVIIVIFLLSCSKKPDAECDICHESIYSEDAILVRDRLCCERCCEEAAECDLCGEHIFSDDTFVINDNYFCDICYDRANICDFCGEKYIYCWYEGTGYCDACIENGNVLFCCICQEYKNSEEVLIEPRINGYSLVDNVCNDCFYDVAIPKYCGTDFYSTWENLIDANGGNLVWGTLTDKQRNYVKYPYFDYEKVYFVPEGYAFHSVDWCYTLSNSNTIYHCTYDTACDFGLEPCSKCVYFED